jgi:hypothetical protein
MRLTQTSHRHSDVAAQMRPAKKFRVFFVVAAVVVLLSIFKGGIHWFGLEFLTLNTLLTSGIGGAIFILGFLLSSVLSDYKEAERIPTEIRVALEAIHSNVESFAAANEKVNLSGCRAMLTNVVHLIREGLDHANNHATCGRFLSKLRASTVYSSSLSSSAFRPTTLSARGPHRIRFAAPFQESITSKKYNSFHPSTF